MESGKTVYTLLAAACLLTMTSGFESGPCYTQNIVDIDNLYYNSYLTTNTGLGLPTVSVDMSANLSTDDHDFDICYFGETGYSHYFTAVNSVYGYYYLLESAASATFITNSALITGISDYRLHENDLIVDASISLYNSPSSARHLYGTSPSAGYGVGDHWWFLLPYSSSTGSTASSFFVRWGTSGATSYISKQISRSYATGTISSSTWRRNVVCRGICGPNKYFEKPGDLAVAFRRSGVVRLISPERLTRFDYTAFETVLYTVYQSIEGGQLPRPDFKTRNAIVIREKTTGLALTPRTNNRNKLEFVGRWSDSNTTEYARVFAEDYNQKFARFQRLEAARTNPVLAADVKDQKYPDSRFFYYIQVAPGEYYLELVSHKGFFLAVLSQTYSSSLIVTRKAAEQPGMLTFKFRLDIPDATNASTPPNLDTATERYIVNNYNKIEAREQLLQ